MRWLIGGVMPLSELKATLNIRERQEEERGRYNPAIGSLQSVSGHLLKTAELVAVAGWHFEVIALNGKRLGKVTVAQARADQALFFSQLLRSRVTT